MSNYNEKISYWVDLAEYDLKTAEAMLETKRLLYVGFMCHQAIEKMLKAYYVKEIDDTPPFTHNLSMLANQSKIYNKFIENHKNLIDTLEPLNIEARYPTDKENLFKSLTLEKCQEMIDKTRRLAKWLKTQL